MRDGYYYEKRQDHNAFRFKYLFSQHNYKQD